MLATSAGGRPRRELIPPPPSGRPHAFPRRPRPLPAAPGQLKVDYAISREMTNRVDGGKLYVQHVIAQNGAELFNRLDAGAHVYFCGLKGMMPPILETLEEVAALRGVTWEDRLRELKARGQWHVEVY